MKFNSYFKNEKLAKIIMSVLLFLLILIVAGMFVVKAEDNKRLNLMTRGGRRYWMMMSGDHNWYSILSKPVIKEL